MISNKKGNIQSLNHKTAIVLLRNVRTVPNESHTLTTNKFKINFPKSYSTAHITRNLCAPSFSTKYQIR